MAKTQEDKKQEGESNIPPTPKPTEEKFVFSAQEVADIRNMMAKSAEKDRIIEDLTQGQEVLRDELAKKSDVVATPTAKDRKITTHYCRMHKFEDKWVLGWTGSGVYREVNSRGEREEYINVIIKDRKDPVKMRFLDYINELPQVTVKIKEKRKLPDTITGYGDTEKVVFDEKTGVMVGLGYSVPSEVVTENWEYVLDLDGEDVVINSRFIN